LKRSFAVWSAGACAALALVSCFGDSTGPAQRRAAGVAFRPVFDVRASAVVDFTRVRVILVRPESTNEGQLALDTTIDFPAGADSVRLPVTVQLAPGATSEPFDLMLEMLNSVGAVVFRGGPVRVTVTTGILSAAGPDVPMAYVGVGSDAAGVRFRPPVPSLVYFDSAAVFVAEAYDAAGAAIAGTPVVYQVDPADSAKARVPDASVGRVVGRRVRGPAAVVARLLTGQTARTTLQVQPLPAALAVTGGGAQTGTVHAALSPITVRVTGADGLGVRSVAVGFAVTSGGGSLSTPTTTTDTAGYASVLWTLGTGAGSQSITATAGALAPVPITATAVAGAANRLAFSVQPATAGANLVITPSVQVAARDSFGNTVPTFTGTVSLGFGANPSQALLGGTVASAAVAGLATFSTLTVSNGGTGYTLVASATGLTPATSAAFNVTGGVPTKLAFITQPSTTAAGAAIAPAVRVAVQDVNGTTVPSAATRVTLALGTNPAADTLSGTLAASAVNGVVTFSDLTLRHVASGVTLVASAASLASATSTTFNVQPGGATRLAFTVQPASTVAGAVISPAVQVAIQDANGNTVTSATGNVSLTLATNPGETTLGGTTTVAAVAGIARFSSLTLDRVASGYTLLATATGLTNAVSQPFNVLVGTPVRLAFLSSPTNAVAGVPLAPTVQVAIEDAGGNIVTTASGSVTLAIGTNPGGATLSGTTTVSAVSGVAVFSTVSLDRAGAGYTLVASATGLSPATSPPFTVQAGNATKLAFLVQPTSVAVGAAIVPAVTVAFQDVYGNVVPSATGGVTMGIGVNPANATLSGTTTVAAVGGVATFANLSLNQVANGYTLVASVIGGTQFLPAGSTAFNVLSATAGTLTLESGGGQSAAPGAQLSQPIVVKVMNAAGGPVSGQAVSFSVTSGGGSVGTSSAVSNASGLASTTWTLGSTPGQQLLTATATGFTGSPLSVGAFAVSIVPQLIGAGQQDTALISVVDPATAPIVWTLANTDPNVLGVPATVTIPTGANAVKFIVQGKVPGQATVTATASGMSPIVVTYRVTTPHVLPYPPGNSLVLSGGPVPFVVLSTDSTGGPHLRTTALAVSLRTSSTSVLLTDAAATIPAGEFYTTSLPLMTPVGTGSAWLYASATGQASDSVLISVILGAPPAGVAPADPLRVAPALNVAPVPVVLESRRVTSAEPSEVRRRP
jgi:hypothetical protein